MPVAVNGFKICARKNCEHGSTPQPVTNFAANSRTKDKVQAYCKDCNRKTRGTAPRARGTLASKGLKMCSTTKCIHKGALQAVSNFRKDSRGVDGLHSQCKDCCKAYHEQDTSKIRDRDYRLRRAYNITLEQWSEMLIGQRGRCGCCGIPLALGTVGQIDSPDTHHNHTTGQVIGIWCHPCNASEGMLRTSDRAFLLARAMQETEALTWRKAA